MSCCAVAHRCAPPISRLKLVSPKESACRRARKIISLKRAIERSLVYGRLQGHALRETPPQLYLQGSGYHRNKPYKSPICIFSLTLPLPSPSRVAPYVLDDLHWKHERRWFDWCKVWPKRHAECALCTFEPLIEQLQRHDSTPNMSVSTLVTRDSRRGSVQT